jgi:hypothetical protein
LNELKRQAERKATLKMFYSAADVFRDYRGPYAHETAHERERLASEYEQLGRAAEQQRWGDGSGPAGARETGCAPRAGAYSSTAATTPAQSGDRSAEASPQGHPTT